MSLGGVNLRAMSLARCAQPHGAVVKPDQIDIVQKSGIFRKGPAGESAALVPWPDDGDLVVRFNAMMVEPIIENDEVGEGVEVMLVHARPATLSRPAISAPGQDQSALRSPQ